MNETKKVSRRKYTAEFTAKVVLEAMQESQTLPELCSKYQLSPNQINQWKKQLKERSADAFKTEANAAHGRPEIINSDQGSQFTSNEYVRLLEDNGISISMGS